MADVSLQLTKSEFLDLHWYLRLAVHNMGVKPRVVTEILEMDMAKAVYPEALEDI